MVSVRVRERAHQDLNLFNRTSSYKVQARLPIKHDYFDKDLSRKGAAPATGRDTLIKLQGRVARKLDTHDSENRLAGLPPRITRIT